MAYVVSRHLRKEEQTWDNGFGFFVKKMLFKVAIPLRN